MPRLFLKLFGTFWLTTVLILSISIFSTYQLADDDSAARLADPREVDSSLRDVLDTGGMPALRRWVADESNFLPGQTVFVVDEFGNELLERKVPGYLEERLDRIWNNVDRDARRRSNRDNGERRRANRPFTPVLEVDGGRWLAIPGPTPPPRFGVLSSGTLLWLVLGLAALTSLVTFWLLSRSLSTPARAIASAADRFASGDMSARVGPAGRSHDEIGEVARQFDRMAEQLEAQAELQRELFRNILHELRSPLARLQIATELLERKPQESIKQIARIRDEIGVLDSLTTQILSLAQATQSNILEGSSLLSAVIEKVVGNAQLEADLKDVTIVTEMPTGKIFVPVDELLLSSAIENVLRNAVQAAPDGSRIGVEGRVDGDAVEIDVTDNGSGVPDHALQQIFEPFYRLDTNRDGSGIGLAITKRVMQRCGGSVTAINADDGGLTVSLRLPIVQD